VTKVASVFQDAIGQRVKFINFARLPTAEPRMEISISAVRGYFVISDCSPITNAEADAIRGSTIERLVVEINDDVEKHNLPACLSITVEGGASLELTVYAPIYYMNRDTQMFERFPVPMHLRDDQTGYGNPFGNW
jgi:hypothetical protein